MKQTEGDPEEDTQSLTEDEIAERLRIAVYDLERGKTLGPAVMLAIAQTTRGHRSYVRTLDAIKRARSEDDPARRGQIIRRHAAHLARLMREPPSAAPEAPKESVDGASISAAALRRRRHVKWP